MSDFLGWDMDMGCVSIYLQVHEGKILLTVDSFSPFINPVRLYILKLRNAPLTNYMYRTHFSIYMYVL